MTRKREREQRMKEQMEEDERKRNECMIVHIAM
jgi:hypothetical protein